MLADSDLKKRGQFPVGNESNSERSDGLMRGAITFPDRLQRILLGLCLMILTILGLIEGADWKAWLALALQVELVVTGLAGWCPVYWACRVGSAAAEQ